MKKIAFVIILIASLLFAAPVFAAPAAQESPQAPAQPFDLGTLDIGGVSLILFVLGLTEFIKTTFNLEGQKVTMIAASTGAIMALLYNLIGWVPEPFGQIVTIVVTSVAGGLSAAGFYRMGKPALDAAKAFAIEKAGRYTGGPGVG